MPPDLVGFSRSESDVSLLTEVRMAEIPEAKNERAPKPEMAI
jgi:hypothetical protein